MLSPYRTPDLAVYDRAKTLTNQAVQDLLNKIHGLRQLEKVVYNMMKALEHERVAHMLDSANQAERIRFECSLRGSNV